MPTPFPDQKTQTHFMQESQRMFLRYEAATQAAASRHLRASERMHHARIAEGIRYQIICHLAVGLWQDAPF